MKKKILQRLPEKEAFTRVFKARTFVEDRHFRVYTRENNLGFSRLGLAVSKKRIRLSSHRNLVKRIVRETFRINSIAGLGLDFVVQAKSFAGEKKGLSQSLKKIFSEIDAC